MFAELESYAWMWIGIMVIAGGWVIPATASAIAKNLRKARESEHLTMLKQSMIERGMSADEIERVVNAGIPHEKAAEGESASTHE
jgi:hypothetical protein